MKLVKLKEVIKDLEKLKESYENLVSLIADQVRDKQIDEASENLEKLKALRIAIEQMGNLNVQIKV